MPTEGLLCGRFNVQRKAEREGRRQRKKGQRITLLRTRKDKDVSVVIDMWGIQGHLVFFLVCTVLQIMYSERFFSNSKKLLMG